MISQLTGTVAGYDLNSLTIDVGGVGYRVFATAETLSHASAGKRVTLHTHLAVRENAMDLYGFETPDERDFFELLLSAPGIGPKSALAVLSVATVPTLQTAIANEDISYLTKVSGIGKKTAEKIIVALKDKIAAGHDGEHMRGASDIVDVLQSLGYTAREAQEAVRKIPADAVDTNARVKEALKILGGR